ncbi:MAG: cell envelope integrity protein CreD [Desulfobacterales bacterium]|nr:cell envelope integrity protein CreD [Desulfobacterales bacterium]
MNQASRLSRALQTSLKAGLVGILVLLFLIPVGMIREVRSERERYRADALADVSSKAGGRTLVAAPFLAVPVRWEARETNAKGETLLRTRREIYIVFPRPSALPRRPGSNSGTGGSMPCPCTARTPPWTWSSSSAPRRRVSPASGSSGPRPGCISSTRTPVPSGKAPSLPHRTEPARSSGPAPPIELAARSVSTPVRLFPGPSGEARLAARLDLALSGAEALHFLALGDSNTLTLSSDWPSPSFAGIPPARRNGTWGNRGSRPGGSWTSRPGSCPGSWPPRTSGRSPRREPTSASSSSSPRTSTSRYTGPSGTRSCSSSFPSRPSSSSRSSPGGACTWSSTSWWVWPTASSISSCWPCPSTYPFLAAYLASAAAVCAVTTFYVSAFLPDKRQALLAFAVLALQYGYLFCALSSEDYALLIGSVGLFGVVALTMAATRKVDWFGGKGEAVRNRTGNRRICRISRLFRCPDREFRRARGPVPRPAGGIRLSRTSRLLHGVSAPSRVYVRLQPWYKG